MLEGEWPKGCDRCRIEEQNNIASKRQLDLERWYPHYAKYDLDQDSFITASIAFGNTCNLKCITCGPHSSSKWQKEYFDITGINIEAVDFYRKGFVDNFVDSNTEIIHIDIPGGEPFLSGVDQQQHMLSRYIESGQSHNISLHYTTNTTIYPDSTWWNLWQHFREIDLQLSIDGIDQRFEYIRFPASWSKVRHNVDRYLETVSLLHNVRLSVSHTVSAYNIFYLEEFFDWCQCTGLPDPWLGRVHRPEYMRPTVWPEQARAAIAETLRNSKYQTVKCWYDLVQQENDSVYFDTFRQMLQKHDAYRSLDFTKIFPEMSQYL